MTYLAILKSRAGEFSALEKLENNTKKTMIPLLEVTDIPWDYKTEKAAKTLNQHVDKFTDKLAKSWGVDYPIMIDLPSSLQDGKVSSGDHLLKHLLDEGRTKNLKFVPVTGFGRGSAYNAEVRTACAIDKRGACLRLEPSDLTGPNSEAIIDALLAEIGIDAAESDVVLDFKEILSSQEKTILLALQQTSSRLPHLKKWRSVTFAASSFPKDLSAIGPNETVRLPRTEWSIWKAAKADAAGFPFELGFGDYAISHPVMSEVDPRLMRMSANIRYTSDDEWVVLKGRSVKTSGYGQYSDPLSKELIGLRDYRGPAYSVGDKFIQDCAKGTVSSGNATTWKFVGVNHHLTLAAELLSKLS